MLNKFRAPTGQLYYRQLFYEETGADKTGVVYTLKRDDHVGYPSLYKLYMEADDLSEYTFATAYLDGWEHWTKLCECTWFKPYVRKWREELEVRAKGRALNAIRTVANSDTKESFQANKFLLNGEWKDKPKHGRGRPTKDEIKQEAQRQVQSARDLENEFQRVLGVVN